MGTTITIVVDWMLLGMQDFDFAQILITFAQILLKSSQICPNLINFAPQKVTVASPASPDPTALTTTVL